MGREIKFRYWAGHKMEYDVVAGRFGIFYAQIDPKDSACLSPTTKYDNEEFVMQATGIKDKKKLEIWEGDIIKWDEGWAYPEMRGLVKWTVGGFVFKNEMVEWHMDKSIWRDVEVIGNIFENPELLK